MALSIADAVALVRATALVLGPHLDGDVGSSTWTTQQVVAANAALVLIDASLTAAEGGGIDNHQRGPFRALAGANGNFCPPGLPDFGTRLAALQARAAALTP